MLSCCESCGAPSAPSSATTAPSAAARIRRPRRPVDPYCVTCGAPVPEPGKDGSCLYKRWCWCRHHPPASEVEKRAPFEKEKREYARLLRIEQQDAKMAVLAGESTKRRGRKPYAHVGPPLTPHQVQEVFCRQKHRCAYCSSHVAVELDFETPLSRGGQRTMENARAACTWCAEEHRLRSEAAWKQWLKDTQAMADLEKVS